MCLIIVTHKDVEHKFYQSDNWRILQESISDIKAYENLGTESLYCSWIT